MDSLILSLGEAITTEKIGTTAFPYVPNTLNTNCKFLICLYRAWEVGRILADLKSKYITSRQEAGYPSKRKGTQRATWGSFLRKELQSLVGSSDVVMYTRRRIQIYASFTKEQMANAHIDFTTALYLCTLPETIRNKWINIAQNQLVSQADIKAALGMQKLACYIVC
jgi:hypothetical protein